GGASTLNGTSGAGNVIVQAGTLSLGASNRLADNATVSVASGSTLDLGAFDDTVGLALLNGTLAGAGTLTAGEYDLNGATVNANLGAGNLFNVGGVSTLSGTSGAANVIVQAGTLSLGASDRLADTATVSVASGSTLDLGAFDDTVGLALLNGTLAGTGTLTAGQYQLNGATVNANLGAGALFNLGGVSTLTGTAAAEQISLNAGTLRLGASGRLSDTATVSVATGATFALNGFNERIGALYGTGDVNVGAGSLTFGGVESGFGGRLSGAGSLVHTGGLFTLMGDHTVASISNTGGELRFLGATTGGLSASGGSVTGAGTIGGALRASNGAILSPGLAGVQDGVGGFIAGGLTLNGGALAIDVLGKSGGARIDQLRINGAATLTGGLLRPTFQGSAATDFDFSTRYLFLQANNLVGTFANGGSFTAAGPENLFWRVRYDLSPNAAVLELRELTNFDPGETGTGNQRSVGQALSGGQLAAADDWAAILALIAGLSPADQAAAFDSISGEPLADVTTSLFSANDSFLTAVRDGGLSGLDDGGEALNFVDRLSFTGGRETSADRLGDVLGAFDPSASTGRGAGGWVSAYAGDQTLDGKPGQATVESSLNGFAGGYGVRNGSMSVGAAGGVTRLEGDVASRQGHYESDLSHAAGYAAFDDGTWAADLTASFYGGDLDTRRGITIGAFSGQAIGNTHVEGQSLSASVARRFQVSDNTMIALGAIGTASNASVDGYTETGAGGLSLVASGMERDWQSLQLSARGTQDYRVNGQGYRIYAGAGVMATAGDRQATGDMRFSGAPTGFGTFIVEGAETPPLAGLAEFGLEVGAGDGVTVSAGYRGLFSERLQDNQVGVKLKVSW
ncbi:autotransporter domain-containing protein, partial [Brevundimonas sp.]|uniref:autotransporter outer membrane beta-barrel domain-containing protein n=1 Tax=Brevundimonas sp. TaxID=1871086 RepID=UPI003564B7F2